MKKIYNNMNIIHSGENNYDNESLPTIFLAGPTIRDNKYYDNSWRYKAIEIFNELNFNGNILIPEPFCGDYSTQIEWELKGMSNSDIILMWIPRDISTELYGLTTNIEFGMYLKDSKLIYGRPDDSDKNRYLDYVYNKYHNQSYFNNLHTMIKTIITNIINK